MAIRAEAVDILVRKSRFEPEVALGVAEAIEVSMSLAQLVTVPVLDSRLQELKGEIQAARAEFKDELGKMQVSMANELAKVRVEMQQLHAELRLEMQKLHVELQLEMQKLHADLQLEIQKFHTELQKVNANLVRWVFLTMLGSVALSMASSTALKMLTN